MRITIIQGKLPIHWFWPLWWYQLMCAKSQSISGNHWRPIGCLFGISPLNIIQWLSILGQTKEISMLMSPFILAALWLLSWSLNQSAKEATAIGGALALSRCQLFGRFPDRLSEANRRHRWRLSMQQIVSIFRTPLGLSGVLASRFSFEENDAVPCCIVLSNCLTLSISGDCAIAKVPVARVGSCFHWLSVRAPRRAMAATS